MSGLPVQAMILATACLTLLACFDKPADVDFDAGPRDAAVLDARRPDAGVCVPDTIVCDDASGHYIECSSAGTVTVDVACVVGCAPTEEKCLDVDPSNGVGPYLDMAANGDDVLVAQGTTWTVDTNDGTILAGTQPVTLDQAEFSGMRVLIVKSLDLRGTVKVTGTEPLVIVSDGDVKITGILDVSADAGTAGPGALEAGACLGAETSTAGAGGAGHYEVGGAGGASGESGGAGGAAARDDDASPLVGGCRGGCVGCIDSPLCGNCSHGGAGGGAVQIVSRTEIAVTGGGKIDAGGGGGRSGSNVATCARSGGGGGSGGTILLEAPTTTIDGTGSVVAARGGGGAATGNGSAPNQGHDGDTLQPAAAGGDNLSCANGGAGGTESLPPVAGVSGGGGGGGASGQVRINNRSGIVAPSNGAAIRARHTVGLVGTRISP
ncbi:MAG: hypothetical protein H6708_14600 [Kofleriaceae bacterium]|nr:hypothetical protein [Myxococcales bacterium]MCB9561633.1 hypothetical protein [Kofleriaceae bacterium]